MFARALLILSILCFSAWGLPCSEPHFNPNDTYYGTGCGFLVASNKTLTQGTGDATLEALIDASFDTDSGHTFTDVFHHYFACIDDRTEDPILGSAGGDMAEFMVGLRLFSKNLTSYNLTQSDVTTIMTNFVQNITYYVPTRRFYMHTDSNAMNRLLQFMNVAVFPTTLPSNSAEWFQAVVNTSHIGCGHLRLMISNPLVYDVPTELLQMAFQSYFTLLWDPSMSMKMHYHVLAGSHDAGAEVMLETVHVTEKRYHVLVTPDTPNRQGLHMYHITAQDELRTWIIVPFFNDLPLAIANGVIICADDATALATTQREASLAVLAPTAPRYRVITQVGSLNRPVCDHGSFRYPGFIILLVVLLNLMKLYL